MYRTRGGRGAGFGLDPGSVVMQELLDALDVVHWEGTSITPWCFGPAEVKVRVGDLNVMVYGFSVMTAFKPAVAKV